MDSSAPKRAAREVQSHRPVRWAARAGYAASGLVHILIGVLALIVAFGGDGETDQAGALMAIAGAPLGFIVLWFIAGTLWALGLWHLLDGIRAWAPSDDVPAETKKWGRRISAWGQSLIFIALGFIAASVALGAHVDAEETTEDASRGLLQVPGGPIVLALVGLGIGIGGVTFIVMGLRRTFRNRIEIPRHGIGRGLAGLGLVGFVAKGIALVIVGVLLIVAALRTDADAAGALDGALNALIALPYGPWLVGAVGIGFVAYGVFCLFRARYAKL